MITTEAYSLNDNDGDESMSRFDMTRVPSSVFTVLRDIMNANKVARFHLVPWSPVSTASASHGLYLTHPSAGLDENDQVDEWREYSDKIHSGLYVGFHSFNSGP